MKKALGELMILAVAGGLIWAAVAFFIKLPERPSLISVDNEKALGEKYYKALLKLPGTIEAGTEATDSILAIVTKRLNTVDSMAMPIAAITVVENPMINAFALPGGYILVTTGLIEFCNSTEEFMSIICHEAGHIHHRHIISRLLKDFGMEILLSDDLFVAGEISGSIISSGYNRQQELDADLYACELLERCGMEPRSLATIFRRLRDEMPEMAYDFEIVASHPDMDKRIRQVLSYKPAEGFAAGEPWFEWIGFKD